MNTKVIVVVEDDWDIRELIKILLSSQGYRILTFSNLRECQQLIAVKPPDLFILDVNLPDGDGIAYCSELRTRESTNSIPILVMSANDRKRDAIQGGATEFIEKPFDIHNFKGTVERLMHVAAVWSSFFLGLSSSIIGLES